MAKLADAADLKSAGAKSPVGVRFPLPAPRFEVPLAPVGISPADPVALTPANRELGNVKHVCALHGISPLALAERSFCNVAVWNVL